MSGRPLAGFTAMGRRNFKDPASLAVLQNYDLMLTAGGADANPTTVMESAAWGLHPVRPLTSGYVGERGLTNIPYGQPSAAAAVLRRILSLPTAALLDMRAGLDERLDSHYCWPRFVGTARAAIESRPPPPQAGTRPAFLAARALVGSVGPLRKPGLQLRQQLVKEHLKSLLRPSSP